MILLFRLGAIEPKPHLLELAVDFLPPGRLLEDNRAAGELRDKDRPAGNRLSRDDLIAVGRQRLIIDAHERRYFVASGSDDRVHGLAEKPEKFRVCRIHQIEAGIEKDPIARPIIEATVMEDIVGRILVSMIEGRQAWEIVDPGQKLIILQPACPVDVRRAEMIENGAPRNLRDFLRRFVCIGSHRCPVHGN